MKTVNAIGKTCPVPLIMTKKALADLPENETLEILSDNEVSVKNITHFLNEHKMTVSTEKTADGFRLLVRKTGSIPDETKVEDYCPVEQNKSTSYIAFAGPDHLDFEKEDISLMMLVKAIQTLPEIPEKPDKMIFMKYGVFLTLDDSPALESLKMLEATGTEILTCGNCLEYFGKTDKHSIGRISNMYEILDSLRKTGKVIYL
jgi:selenium metabolism protein YedF